MIKEFVERWERRTDEVEAQFAEEHPRSYSDIVRAVVEVLSDKSDYAPNPERIHEINDGDYQGTLVFVIGASGYQPSDYWYIRVDYGSCSGCDTLEAIYDYNYSGRPTPDQVRDYMTLALHVVQGLKKMDDRGIH